MPVGIFGGTFDPVHIGHLRTALELRDHLGLDTMLMIPCGDPPHRDSPMTTAGHRLEMLKLAVAGESGLVADSREIDRGGFSYSLETLLELRGELGADVPISFCIGMDALVSLDQWHRWRELLDHCHIVVAARPGWTLPGDGDIARWLEPHRIENPAAQADVPGGGVFVTEMTLLPVSATDLRTRLAEGRSIRYLTPDAVIDYIYQNNLYQRPQRLMQENR